MPNLPHQRDRFQPSEALLDTLPLPLTDGISRVLRRASINRTPTGSLQILSHVRRDLQVATFGHEICRVISLSPPTVICFMPGICSSITSAASRSAVPLASNTSVLTISPWRFSTSRLARQLPPLRDVERADALVHHFLDAVEKWIPEQVAMC